MNDKTSGLAAVHAAAAMSGTSPVAITLAPTASSAAPAKETVSSGPEMVGMPKADYEAQLAAANANGRKDGAAAERTRIKAIVAAPEAKGREALAHSIAFETELAPEQAVAMLKAAPEAQRASRLDGLVPAPKIDSVDPATSAATKSAGLAAAVQRQIEKTYGKAAV